MSWIADAGRRFWQAYCEGLEMSCPVHNRIADRIADRFCERDRNHDGAARSSGAELPTVH
ncbi:hypothetical protein SAMN05660666_02117 [Novosphingobium aromaticivorans]|nr:hypothetical protein SAMN05660666_02117 [Novosphingobium aromaticivorans]